MWTPGASDRIICMNTKIKDGLGVALILTMAILALTAVGYVKTYSRSLGPLSLRNFTVDGEGEVVAVPNVGQFSATVITEGGENVEALQVENSKKSDSVVSFLKNNGVEEKDIQTSRYSVNPKYQSFRCDFGDACPPAKIAGYVVTQTVTVKVRNLDSAGELLAGVVENGSNSVSGLTFTIDDTVELEKEARALAVTQARDKAQAIAEAGEFKLGDILSVQTVDSPVYSVNEFADARGGELSPAPAIEPGSEKVTARVIVTYEIR